VFVPFHVSTIKSVSTKTEGQWTFLRINFHISGGNTMQFPPIKDPNALFVKELTLKNQATKIGGENHLINAAKEIKELIKKVNDLENAAAAHAQGQQEASQIEELITIKGKKESLDNLVIRPNIVGKKTVGNLEIHTNGVRFLSSKGHTVDIPFSNVKHAFFQPCAEDELIVIIHFHLKIPIQVGSKKVLDIQFFKESGSAADDLDNRNNRKRLTDKDEIEAEDLERQQKKKLNNRFQNFVKLIES
jgi:nucleosome binding factor SPN SPT16 subunit